MPATAASRASAASGRRATATVDASLGQPLRQHAGPRHGRSCTTTTRDPSASDTPVGLQMSAAGRSDGTTTRRGTRSASASVAAIRAARGWCAHDGRRATVAVVDTGLADASGVAAGTRSGRFVNTNPTTCFSVGKSRSFRFSCRGMSKASRTAANVSACFTVSTPRSASRSRSMSSMSCGYPVFSATMSSTFVVTGSRPAARCGGVAAPRGAPARTGCLRRRRGRAGS